MIVEGRVRNGVVVLPPGVHLPEGQDVRVLSPTPEASPAAVNPKPVEMPPGRAEALTRLIGLWAHLPAMSDDDVTRLVDEERTRKHS